MRPKEIEPETTIITLYTNGKSVTSIQKLLKIGTNKIKRVLARNNINIVRPPNYFKGLTKETSQILLKKAQKLKQRYRRGELVGSNTGRHHTIDEKRKVSEKMKGNKNATHRVDRQNFYNGIRMDSKWEIGTAKYFDRNNINWTYNERSFVLSDGKHYFPDFFVYEDNKLLKLVEVKGLFRDANKRKFEQFKREYPSIIVELWDRNILYKLGVIDINGYII